MKTNDSDTLIKQLAHHVNSLDQRGTALVYDYMLVQLLVKMGFKLDSEYLEGWIVVKPKELLN